MITRATALSFMKAALDDENFENETTNGVREYLREYFSDNNHIMEALIDFTRMLGYDREHKEICICRRYGGCGDCPLDYVSKDVCIISILERVVKQYFESKQQYVIVGKMDIDPYKPDDFNIFGPASKEECDEVAKNLKNVIIMKV